MRVATATAKRALHRAARFAPIDHRRSAANTGRSTGAPHTRLVIDLGSTSGSVSTARARTDSVTPTGDTSRAARPHPLDGSIFGESERRSILALAEALIPGGGVIPRADERSVAEAEKLLEHLFPHLASVWAKAALLFDHLTILRKGRRFRDLSHADQEEMLRAWEANPALRAPLTAFTFALKFVHFDRKDTYSALGGKLNVVTNLEQPRWLGQVHRASEWNDGDVECEVVVIGTGAGGAVVGKELAERGFAVVYVEEGELHRRDSFDGSSLKAHQEFYRGGVAAGNNLFPVFMGRLVGGSTAVNGGTSFRTPRPVLDRWCEETQSADFAPDAMEPHFQRVESILMTEPAKRQFVGKIADVFEKGCDAHGWHHFAFVRNAPGCEGSGFCDFGCRTDARRSTNISYVPPALEKGAMLFTGLRASRVIVENGRAVGVECESTKDGRNIRVRARAVILAGGAVPTPLFLLRQGLCTTSGQVGRNLTLHPSGGMSALFDFELRGFEKIPQGYGCDEFLDDGILLSAAQPDFNLAPVMFPFGGDRLMEVMSQLTHIASFGILIADEQKGRVLLDAAGMSVTRYDLTRGDVERYKRGIVRMSKICFAAGAKKVWPGVFGTETIDSPEALRRFERHTKLSATDLLLTSYHPLGTVKMGRDPRTSVVDLSHEAHDLPGLFVVDGSVVSGPLGVNPQLTIMAVATRAAGRIAERLS